MFWDCQRLPERRKRNSKRKSRCPVDICLPPASTAATPFTYALKAPLILTDSNKTAVAVKHTTGLGTRSGYVLGGAGLISDKVVKNIFSMASGEEITVK